jgi:hypothetical protein
MSIELSSSLALAQAREALRRPSSVAADTGATASTPPSGTVGGVGSQSGDRVAHEQAPRLERGARSLSGGARGSGAPALPGNDVDADPSSLYGEATGEPKGAGGPQGTGPSEIDHVIDNDDGDSSNQRRRAASPAKPGGSAPAPPTTATSRPVESPASREVHFKRLQAVTEAMRTPPELRSAHQKDLIRAVGVGRALRMIQSTAAGRMGGARGLD